MEYDHREIEARWKSFWKENKTYQVSNDSEKPKYYVLDMFPYPSGAGLHVGHPLGYVASDIFSRYKRLKGFNVLHPMGFDAFGLPAEQYAIQTRIHPAVSTAQNIKKYHEQLDNIGFCYDWSREVWTSDPAYYKWTQWIFLKLFDHYYDKAADKAMPIDGLTERFAFSGNAGVQAATTQETIFSAETWKSWTPKQQDEMLMNYRLAYRKVSYVNWCEALGTVLANDDIKDGVSERGGHPVVQRPMLQWSLRTTAYAERLLKDLDTIDWTDALKTQQRNWIGKSEGAQLFFEISGSPVKLEIYTTRPDTIFGATFMVLAPEHPLVQQIVTPGQKKTIEDYLSYVGRRSERERASDVKEVTGAFTGAYCINPFNQQKVPIWIAEYVLKDYGTGAIMAVPSDDERDQAFAEKFGLPIIGVVDKSKYPGATLHDKTGVIYNSDFLDGMEVAEAIEMMLKNIEAMGIGSRRINYKLRDSNFSRQRYWGEPFPIKYDQDGVSHAVERLPVELPFMEDITPSPDGKSPLSRDASWVKMDHGFTRETDTMPAVAGSSWYFLRYMDPHNPDAFASQKALNYWKDVDLYVGGTEHAVSHLLYSRLWHKVLFDLGLVPTNEPFKKLINQGMIQGRSLFLQVGNRKIHVKIQLADDKDRLYRDKYLEMIQSDFRFEGIDANTEICWQKDEKGAEYAQLTMEVEKMSKSKYNVVNPDEVIEMYGADCFRMFEMFLGPIEMAKPWDTRSINGVHNFIRKLWALFYDVHTGASLWTNGEPDKDEYKALHAAIKKTTEDIERFSLNTCVSTFMICVNELKRLNCNKKKILQEFVVLMAPFAPFTAEELWRNLGNTTTVFDAKYPVADESYLKKDVVEYPLCINGKKRGEAMFSVDMSPTDIEAEVRNMAVVRKWTEGQQIRKVIIVSGKMVNLVVN